MKRTLEQTKASVKRFKVKYRNPAKLFSALNKYFMNNCTTDEAYEYLMSELRLADARRVEKWRMDITFT
jgi:hypothetical protein